VNEDTFREKYCELTNTDKQDIAFIKTQAGLLHKKLNEDHLANGAVDGDSVRPRCMAIARTKLEECVMWAVKGITGHG